jgi:DNA polymerase-3 subunit alpha
MADFVHLHVHSDFSLQDAAVSVTRLADRAEELGMSHLALTDHGNMFGAMEFIAACEQKKRKKNVKPIIGCEVYVSPGSRHEKKGSENENKYYHLVLLAYNRDGYYNLVKLCSYAYTEGFYYRPRIDEELLSKYHEGLIALSACASGEIPRLIQGGKKDEAEKKALYYRDLFGNDADGNPNFYLEIQDHGIPSGGLRGSDLSQKDINEAVAAISKKTNIPLVATNDVHYLDKDDFIAHDVLLCIGTGKVRTEEKRKKYYGDQFYFKTGDEMAEIFAAYPEAIENTVKIAQRCNADVPKIETKDLPQYLPEFEIPGGFKEPSEYLRHLTAEGLEKRYAKVKENDSNKWEEIKKRADYELDTIINMGYTGYFLIVADFINYAKEKDIPVGPGRGSGAGSIVAYSLRITDIEPLKYGLIFERFLNPERISMPDFDIDFANEGREEVINYVTRKYGKERVAQIITFGTLGAKAVIKDVARVLGISISESEMITKLISFDPDITLDKAKEEEPRLKEMENDPRFTELFVIAHKLEGLNRHSSIHAAGIVIGKKPLIELVPLFQEREERGGNIATQYSMNFLEQCGLVKMDFLGLKNLDIIKHTKELIRQRGGKYSNFNIENIPEDDKKTFKMLGDGKSHAVFQFASDGMEDMLRQTKPASIEDLTALNARYRAGPMQFIPRFVECKNGKAQITYPDPSLEGILKETYGVIVYQEQVMEVARIIAGYSMGKADLLRRAMGKKKKEILDGEKIPFLEGAAKQGYSAQKAGAIFDMLVPFAGYGFNKSHAAAYSVLAYQTAYLKANFPAEYMAATLIVEIKSADRLLYSIVETRKMGINVDPPNINYSNKLFTVVDGRIVYGFLGIKGIGDAPAEEIVRGRQNGHYKNFMDFLERVDIKAVSKKVIELLIHTGAFDNFKVSRETLAGNMEKAIEYAQKGKEDKQLGQSNLFGESNEAGMPDFKFTEFPPVSRAERLNLEKKLIGFYFSGHPLDEYRQLWEKAVKADLAHPETIQLGNHILIGIIKNIKTIISKSGKMAYAALEDYNGEIEVTFFSRTWEACEDKVQDDKVAILKGKIEYQRNKDKYGFIVDSYLDVREVETAVEEEEALQRKREKFRSTWLYMADLKSAGLAKAVKGSYTVIGQLNSLRETKDKNGNDMAFGTLQDFEGDIDLVFWAKTWKENRELLNLGEFVALKGSLDPQRDRDPEKPSLKVSFVDDLAALSRSAARKAEAGEQPKFPPVKMTEKKENSPDTERPAQPLNEIHILLEDEAAGSDEKLQPLRNYLTGNQGPCPVYIHIGKNIIKANKGLSLEAEKDALGVLEGCIGVARSWKEQCK